MSSEIASRGSLFTSDFLTESIKIDCLSGLFNPAALWIHADKGGFPMSATVGGRDDDDASPPRGLARTSEDLRQARRLLSLACVHDGMSQADAAKGGGVARQSLGDRVHRFNEAGPHGGFQKDVPQSLASPLNHGPADRPIEVWFRTRPASARRPAAAAAGRARGRDRDGRPISVTDRPACPARCAQTGRPVRP